MMKREIWKHIPHYVGKYKVSNRGRIKSLPWKLRPSAKILNIQIDKRYGYPYIDLWKNARPKRVYIHVLVITSFQGKKPKGMETRHLNDIKTDNRIENLTWGTRSENMKDSYRLNPNRMGFKKGHPYGLRFGHGQNRGKGAKGVIPWNKGLKYRLVKS